MPVLWALLTALSFSVGQLLVRRALPHSNATTAAWFTSGISGLVLWLLSLTRPFPALTLKVVGGVAVAALFSPFLARVTLYMGFSRLGLSRPAVVVGTSPLFAALLAILWLGEPFTAKLGMGTVATTLGVILLVYEKFPHTDWKKVHLFFPLFAAFCFGARDAVARYGVMGFSSPLTAAAIATTVAWILLSVLFLFGSGEYGFHVTRRGLPSLVTSGLVYVISYYSLFSALSSDYVVVVAPAIHSSPFWMLLLSYLFLRKEEKLSSRVVLGSVLVVLGVTVVTLARKGL